MKVYDQIKEMLCDELEQIAKKKELTSNSLDVLDKGIDIIKDIATIKAMEQEYPDEGYSRDGYSQGYFNRMPYYMYDDGMVHDGNSYARGRGANAKRDSMGRYSSDGRSYDYSREGYSGDTREELQRIMNSAQNEREREAIRKALDNMNR